MIQHSSKITKTLSDNTRYIHTLKILKYTKYIKATALYKHCLLQIQQFYASLNIIASRSDSCNVLSLLEITLSNIYKLGQIYYKLRQAVIINYGSL